MPKMPATAVTANTERKSAQFPRIAASPIAVDESIAGKRPKTEMVVKWKRERRVNGPK